MHLVGVLESVDKDGGCGPRCLFRHVDEVGGKGKLQDKDIILIGVGLYGDGVVALMIIMRGVGIDFLEWVVK